METQKAETIHVQFRINGFTSALLRVFGPVQGIFSSGCLENAVWYEFPPSVSLHLCLADMNPHVLEHLVG